MRTDCLVCSAPLARSGAGRPPAYCSTGCRRAAERELARADARLGRIEGEMEALRLRLAEYAVARPMGSATVPTARARLAALEGEHRAATGRIRDLLEQAPA